MTRSHGLQRAGLLLLAIAGTAFSSGPVLAGEGRCHHKHHGQHHERTAADFAEHQAERMAKLREALALKPAQEPAWQAYTAQMNAIPHPPRPDREAIAKLTAPARLEHMLEQMTAFQKDMELKLSAVKTFYATLDPTQQAAFDAQFKASRRWYKS